MKTTMISLMTAVYMLSAIACTKNNDSKPGLTEFVLPGENIQAAIDSVAAAGGGTVNLATGIFTITSSIRLKANVILNGAGDPNTTITSNTPMTIITTDQEGLENLTVQNLKIIGIANDSASIGIWIASLNAYFKNVKISNVQVTNCGGIGVHIKRADTASVINCNLNHNGKSVFYHNIYVRESSYITISGNALTGSPHGTGLHVAGVCSHFIITGNTVTNNGIAGMNIQDSPDILLIQNNTVSSNGVNQISGHGDGISFTGTNATIESNITDSNYESGIHTWNGSGSVTNNHATGNGTKNYYIDGSYTQSNNL
jgi:parallel beta-helix repeat protein